MKCPTPRCPEKLALGSTRLYCKNCRAGMYRYAKKTPGELISIGHAIEKRKYRIEFRQDRKADQPKRNGR